MPSPECAERLTSHVKEHGGLAFTAGLILVGFVLGAILYSIQRSRSGDIFPLQVTHTRWSPTDRLTRVKKSTRTRQPTPVNMADRDRPGIKIKQLAAAQRAAIDLSQNMKAQGKKVRYIRSAFVPGEAHCMCFFDVANPDVVKELNETAKIPFKRIVEAINLTPK